MKHNKDTKATEKKEPEQGIYFFVDNTLLKVKTGYEKMMEKLKPGQVEMPQNGAVENNFYG